MKLGFYDAQLKNINEAKVLQMNALNAFSTTILFENEIFLKTYYCSPLNQAP